jgi:dipeptidyl aminopeptidase/acylaminoacyl peptidase
MSERTPLQASDLYRLRLISDPHVSPDGRRVAFVLKQMDEKKDDYISNVHMVDDQGKVHQFTSGDKDAAPRWSPDGQYIAFLSGRKEKSQIHLIPAYGGESFPLTELELGAGIPRWSPDSTALVFAAQVSTDPKEVEKKGAEAEDDKKPGSAKMKITDRASYKLDGAGYIGNRRRQLFVIDVETRKMEQITHGDFHNDDPAWSPDGQHLAFVSNRSPPWDVSLESDIYVMPRGGGEARQLTHGGSYHRPIFNPEGDRIALIGRQDAEAAFTPYRLYSIDRAGTDLRDELGDWDGGLGNEIVSDVVRSHDEVGLTLEWRPDGIYFLATVRGECNIHRAAEQVQAVTSGRNTITDFSLADDGSVAYSCAGATTLAEVFVRRGELDVQLTHENDAFLAGVWIAEPERIAYSGANGEKSQGWLLAPRGSERGKHPLVVAIHGGPQLAHGEALVFEYQFLAGQGFGVFYPNIHGSSSYGADYEVSIHRDWGNLDFQDVLAGTEEAGQRPWADNNRIGIAGGSYGGFMTNWVLTHNDRFRAGVADRCLSNIVSFMGTSDLGWIWNRCFGAYPEEDVQKLWDMSPLKYVANVKAPLLLLQYEGDDRTPLEQGEQMFLALRRLGKETRLIMIPEESHGLTRGGKPSRRIERLGHLLEWFKQYL